MIDNDRRLYMRVHRFPSRVEALRDRLQKLEDEADALGLRDIKKNINAVNEEWDRIMEKEQIRAELRGQEYSMGVDHA